ncbi:hypothetical protein V8B97DRAFT_697599 [Scleroderma yunnanense]
MPATRNSSTLEPGVCHICGKTLSRKADLPRHMRTHAANKDELMFPCPYEGCGYKALQRSNLATHLHTHTGERPNKCCHPGCTYSTSDPGSLTRHRRSVHGYEPKAKKSNFSVETARKESRRTRRHSPHSVPSPSSSDGSASSISIAIGDQFPELRELLAAPGCPTVELYCVVATKNTHPGYDTALSPRTLPRSDALVHSSLLGGTFKPETLLQQVEQAPAVSYPQIPVDVQQEALCFATCYVDNLGSWMPPPSFLSNDSSLFIDASSYGPTNTFQDDFSQFLPVENHSVGYPIVAPQPAWEFSQPSFSELTGGFTFNDQLCYTTFSASDGFGASSSDFFSQMSLAC